MANKDPKAHTFNGITVKAGAFIGELASLKPVSHTDKPREWPRELVPLLSNKTSLITQRQDGILNVDCTTIELEVPLWMSVEKAKCMKEDGKLVADHSDNEAVIYSLKKLSLKERLVQKGRSFLQKLRSSSR